jgi:hypothetical protein
MISRRRSDWLFVIDWRKGSPMSGAKPVVHADVHHAQDEKVLARFEIWIKVPSMNEWMRMHHIKRCNIKSKFAYEVACHRILGEIPNQIRGCRIQFRFTQLLGKRCRCYDADNWSVASKIIADVFVALQIIRDDRREFVAPFTECQPEEHRQKLSGGVRVEVLAV